MRWSPWKYWSKKITTGGTIWDFYGWKREKRNSRGGVKVAEKPQRFPAAHRPAYPRQNGEEKSSYSTGERRGKK